MSETAAPAADSAPAAPASDSFSFFDDAPAETEAVETDGAEAEAEPEAEAAPAPETKAEAAPQEPDEFDGDVDADESLKAWFKANPQLKQAFMKNPDLRRAYYRDRAYRQIMDIKDLRSIAKEFRSPQAVQEAVQARQILNQSQMLLQRDPASYLKFTEAQAPQSMPGLAKAILSHPAAKAETDAIRQQGSIDGASEAVRALYNRAIQRNDQITADTILGLAGIQHISQLQPRENVTPDPLATHPTVQQANQFLQQREQFQQQRSESYQMASSQSFAGEVENGIRAIVEKAGASLPKAARDRAVNEAVKATIEEFNSSTDCALFIERAHRAGLNGDPRFANPADVARAAFSLVRREADINSAKAITEMSRLFRDEVARQRAAAAPKQPAAPAKAATAPNSKKPQRLRDFFMS